MNIALLSYVDQNYFKLADITFLNKRQYCDKHGYNFFGNIIPVKVCQGFTKIKYILTYLKNNPTIEWIFWNDADTIITNKKIQLDFIIAEQLILHDKKLLDFIFTKDQAALNCGNFFVKNTEHAQDFLFHLLKIMVKYISHPWQEQQAIIDNLFQIDGYYIITEQNLFNSYDLQYYSQFTDTKGGQWIKDDFLIHFPGMALSKKIELAKLYSMEG